MSFGQRLRQRRMDLGMSRAELAERLGVSPSAIGNYETDQNTVRSDLLPRLFQALRVDPNYHYQDCFTGDFTLTRTGSRRRRRARRRSPSTAPPRRRGTRPRCLGRTTTWCR